MNEIPYMTSFVVSSAADNLVTCLFCSLFKMGHMVWFLGSFLASLPITIGFGHYICVDV